jgi:hypothetical protein
MEQDPSQDSQEDTMGKEENAQPKTSEFGKHVKEAGRAATKQWRSLIPPEFWEQGRVVRRETLLAMRSLVDAAIERLEDKGSTPSNKPAPPRKAKVEVE